jgi:hypothetical protein
LALEDGTDTVPKRRLTSHQFTLYRIAEARKSLAGWIYTYGEVCGRRRSCETHVSPSDRETYFSASWAAWGAASHAAVALWIGIHLSFPCCRQPCHLYSAYSTIGMNEFYTDVQQLYMMVLSLRSSGTLTAGPRSCRENNHILRTLSINI